MLVSLWTVVFKGKSSFEVGEMSSQQTCLQWGGGRRRRRTRAEEEDKSGGGGKGGSGEEVRGRRRRRTRAGEGGREPLTGKSFFFFEVSVIQLEKLLVSQSMVHLFPIWRSVYGPHFFVQNLRHIFNHHLPPVFSSKKTQHQARWRSVYGPPPGQLVVHQKCPFIGKNVDHRLTRGRTTGGPAILRD